MSDQNKPPIPSVDAAQALFERLSKLPADTQTALFSILDSLEAEQARNAGTEQAQADAAELDKQAKDAAFSARLAEARANMPPETRAGFDHLLSHNHDALNAMLETMQAMETDGKNDGEIRAYAEAFCAGVAALETELDRARQPLPDYDKPYSTHQQTTIHSTNGDDLPDDLLNYKSMYNLRKAFLITGWLISLGELHVNFAAPRWSNDFHFIVTQLSYVLDLTGE